MSYPKNDIGSQVKASLANFSGDAAAITRAPALIVAAAGLDNLKFLGEKIDRKDGTGPGLANSVAISTGWNASLTDTKTLSLAHEIQESDDDGVSWDTAEVIEAATVQRTATATTEYKGIDEHDLDLMARKRWYRINVTLDMSAGATDEASFRTHAVQGGYDQIPQ